MKQMPGVCPGGMLAVGIDSHIKCNPLRLSIPLDACKLIHISFSNVVHSIPCLNLLLLIMNHTTRPESGYEAASCLDKNTNFQKNHFSQIVGKSFRKLLTIFKKNDGTFS